MEQNLKDALTTAERASEAKSDFLSRMAHEIRTPMNAIIGMANVAMREDMNDEVRKSLSIIQSSAEGLLAIINDILDGKITTRRELEVEKRQLCRDLKLSKFMSNADILRYAKPEEKELVSGILKKKPTRTMSGVAIVAVMCHPHKCPHGRCMYCPESDIAPPSYTGEEPAALRGRMYEFHPYVQ